MSRGRYWGDEEFGRLRKLCDGTRTVPELAVELCRSTSSVTDQVKRLGLEVKYLRNSRDNPGKRNLKAQIETLCDEGLRAVDIARQLNASLDYTTYVANIYRALGSGIGAVKADPARDYKHLNAISVASKGKGFPYCVARRPLSTTKSNSVDSPPAEMMSQVNDSPKQRSIDP